LTLTVERNNEWERQEQRASRPGRAGFACRAKDTIITMHSLSSYLDLSDQSTSQAIHNKAFLLLPALIDSPPYHRQAKIWNKHPREHHTKAINYQVSQQQHHVIHLLIHSQKFSIIFFLIFFFSVFCFFSFFLVFVCYCCICVLRYIKHNNDASNLQILCFRELHTPRSQNSDLMYKAIFQNYIETILNIYRVRITLF